MTPNKNILSSLFMGTFILTLFACALLSELFQAPASDNYDLDKYRNVFTLSEFSQAQSLEIENRLGVFRLIKDPHPLTNEWDLLYPRELPASSSVVQDIFNALSQAKIRRVYTKDQINMSNFSLNTPLISLRIKDGPHNKTIKIGLINPRDGSTYITSTDKDAIYHVDSLDISLETIGLADIVDSNVISFNQENISRIEIYRGPKEDNRPLLVISLDPNSQSKKWISESNDEKTTLDETRVHKFLDQISNIRSQFILDKRNPELESSIERILNRPYYTFQLYDHNMRKVSYETSGLLSSPLPSIRLESNQNFLIRASNRKHPYIVSKNALSILETKQQDLKKLPFEKLFY